MNKSKEKEIQRITDKIFKEEKRKSIKWRVLGLYACIVALVLLDILVVINMIKQKSDCFSKGDYGCALNKMILWIYTSIGLIGITIFGSITVIRAQKMLKGIRFKASFRKSYQNALDIGLALFVMLIILSFILTTPVLMLL